MPATRASRFVTSGESAVAPKGRSYKARRKAMQALPCNWMDSPLAEASFAPRWYPMRTNGSEGRAHERAYGKVRDFGD